MNDVKLFHGNCLELIKDIPDGSVDCFMGSGSTGVACVRNNRKFIGIELQEKYYEITRNRIAEEQVNTGLPNKVPPFLNLSPGEFNVGGFYSR